jgi:hypothetical protein
VTKNTNINRGKGTKKSFNMSIVDGGYIKVYGGMLAIGYKNTNSQDFFLSASIEEIEELIKEHKEAING